MSALTALHAVRRNSLAPFLIALACWIGLTGGGRLEVGGLELSLRDWRRPAALALLASVWLLWRTPGAGRGPVIARAALLALLLVVPAMALTYLVAAAGGLDSYAYVSAAGLLQAGRLITPEPSGWLPVPAALDALTPLGYLPLAEQSAIVPEFPLGVSAVMALFSLLFGRSGPFLVSPVLAAGAVLLTIVLARRFTTPWAALFAGAAVAVQPVFFTYSLQPMSDVAATFWVLLAATLAMRDRPAAVAAGIAAALAVWTRPPLGLMALLLPLLPQARELNRVRYAAGFLPGLLALMAVQWTLFGGPLTSGHGTAGTLFSLDALAHNAGAHGRWLMTVNTPLLALGLIAAWFAGNRPLLVSALLLFAVEAAPYLFYGVRFDDWEMQRFLLPGVVFLIIVAADGLGAVAARFLPAAGVALAAAVGAWTLAAGSYTFLDNRFVFTIAQAEARFPQVGEWVALNANPDDVVLTSLHSGSVRYYSGRKTVRWDRIPGDRLVDVVRAIGERGGQAVLILDGTSERMAFAQRFGSAAGVQIDYVERIRTADIARVSLRR